MKNFSNALRGFYATFIIALTIFSTAFSVTAQDVTWPQRKPFNNNRETYSQMWNYNSTTWYYGSITFASSGVPNSANYGRQLDTSSDGGIVTLGTSRITAGTVNLDTIILQSTPGYGYLNLTASVLKVSGTPTVTATAMQSSDGFVWVPVIGATVFTISPTSLTVPVLEKWNIVPPLDRFYAVWLNGLGGDHYSGQAWFYYQRTYVISVQK